MRPFKSQILGFGPGSHCLASPLCGVVSLASSECWEAQVSCSRALCAFSCLWCIFKPYLTLLSASVSHLETHTHR